jgi:hypothetical protein
VPRERGHRTQSATVLRALAVALTWGKGRTQPRSLGGGFAARGKIAKIPANSANHARGASAPDVGFARPPTALCNDICRGLSSGACAL